MTTLDTLRLEETAFGQLDAQGRLLNAVLKEPLSGAGRFGFRGDIALAFQEQVADEKRPPEYSLEQVLAVADAATGKIPVLAGYLHDFTWLDQAEQVLAPYLDPAGTYVFFTGNIDFLEKYRVPLAEGVIAYVLPLDESTVWKETLELVGIDKNDIKKLNGAAKLDYVLNKLATFTAPYELSDYVDVLAETTAPRNRNENRPV